MKTTRVLGLWERCNKLPKGNWIFSLGFSLRVPYFLGIRPVVTELRPGYSVVRSKKRWRVHNHLGTFHAIAMCNMAEMAMGTLAEATVPSSHAWIPMGMNVEYRKPAKTNLRAIASLDPLPQFGQEKANIEIPVSIRDTSDVEVCKAVITIRVTPRS